MHKVEAESIGSQRREEEAAGGKIGIGIVGVDIDVSLKSSTST